MSVVRLPRFLGGGPRPEREPAPNWDKETEAMRCVGEWLAYCDDDESRFRVLTHWMWRLKSGKSPNIEAWVDTVAEQSAVELSRRAGFEGER